MATAIPTLALAFVGGDVMFLPFYLAMYTTRGVSEFVLNDRQRRKSRAKIIILMPTNMGRK